MTYASTAIAAIIEYLSTTLDQDGYQISELRTHENYGYINVYPLDGGALFTILPNCIMLTIGGNTMQWQFEDPNAVELAYSEFKKYID